MVAYSAIRKITLLFTLLLIGAPLFYEPIANDRVYPLRVVALRAAEEYRAANQAYEEYRAANQAAVGPRNLTEFEHMVTWLLIPAVFIRAGPAQAGNFSKVAVNAIPLAACSKPNPLCVPDEIRWWATMEHKELGWTASWAVVIGTVLTPCAAWRRGGAFVVNLLLLIGLATFAGVGFANGYTPTRQFAVSVVVAFMEARQIQSMPKTRNTLEKILLPKESGSKDAAAPKKTKKAKESKKAR